MESIKKSCWLLLFGRVQYTEGHLQDIQYKNMLNKRGNLLKYYGSYFDVNNKDRLNRYRMIKPKHKHKQQPKVI